MQGLEEATALDVEAVADSIDSSLGSLRRGVVTPAEALGAIQGSVSLFMRFAVAPTRDVELVLDYARAAVEDMAIRRAVMDPVLVEVFDEWLRGEGMVDELSARLDLLLEELVDRAGRGDHSAMADMAELCRTGRRSSPRLLRLTTSAERILRVASELGCADGLRDAVSPLHHSDGQIARRRDGTAAFVLALDLLAQLAVHREQGAQARSALLDLADHVEVAGEAVVRLPLHLLDDGDRDRLLEIHERRVALFCDDHRFGPLGTELLRDNRLVRGAVWQAFDARHVL